MTNSIKFFLIALPVFLALDFIWIGLISANFYKTALASLARSSGVNFVAAAIAYFLIVFGLSVFVYPLVSGTDVSLVKVFLYGAIFGIVVYGVYDFTNLATLRDWTWQLSFHDMLWGGTVCGLVTMISIRIML